jgi:putative intracellular protease/amidase
LAKKRVLLIISPLDFSDDIAIALKNLLEESGFQVETASTMTGTARGINGTQISISTDLKEANPADYIGAVLVGGPGFVSYFSGYRVLRGKLVEMHESGRLLAAVGEAQLLLARIGVLKGIKIADPRDPEMTSSLKREGANIENTEIVFDHHVLTASNKVSPRELASRVLEHLLVLG